MSEPISFLTASAIVGVAAVPLALGVVPPNRLYGVRTPRVLADSRLWYRVNRFAGRLFLAAAAVSSGVYIANPQLASGRSLLGLAVFLVPLLVALAGVAVYLRRSAGGSS